MAKMQAKNSADERDDGLREKMIAVKRVTKVVKGGRILSFAALVVVGDGDGRIGMGTGKAKEVPVAVQKAMDEARRKMLKVSIKNGTLHHACRGEHGASKVILSPGKEGMICSPGLRSVFYVLGIKNVVAKSVGSTNPYNLLLAVIDGLKKQSTPSEIAAKRGKSLQEIFE